MFPISVDAAQQSMSLFVFLRYVARLPGTKVMCFEGGCGACVVTASYQLPGNKEEVTKAVNAVNVTPSFLRHNSLRLSDVYICVSKLTVFGSDNGLSPGRRQANI